MVALTDEVDALEAELASVQERCLAHQGEAERYHALAASAGGTTAHLNQRLAERAERRAGHDLARINRLLARREQLAAELLALVEDADLDGNVHDGTIQ